MEGEITSHAVTVTDEIGLGLGCDVAGGRRARGDEGGGEEGLCGLRCGRRGQRARGETSINITSSPYGALRTGWDRRTNGILSCGIGSRIWRGGGWVDRVVVSPRVGFVPRLCVQRLGHLSRVEV